MENESKVGKPTGTRYSDEVRERAVRVRNAGSGDSLDRFNVARDAAKLGHPG